MPLTVAFLDFHNYHVVVFFCILLYNRKDRERRINVSSDDDTFDDCEYLFCWQWYQ